MPAMRIIAGEFRGRVLLPPEGQATRPITDRVKQSLFDVLTPRIGGAVVLDIFAGTGSMGLESLSRGAAGAHFFEADRSALLRLRKNIEALKLPAERAVVVPGDVFKWFGQMAARASSPCLGSQNTGKMPAPPVADVVFLDPPYRFLSEKPEPLRELARQLAGGHLAEGAVVVFRHDLADSLDLPPLHCVDRRTYGGMVLEFLAPA
jgi:16S rRNA (guanine966-N2)-methyltransferase